MNNLFNIDSNFITNEITEIDIEASFNNYINEKRSITGVQKKLSLVFNGESKITILDKNAEYIIKPNTKEFPCIAQAEFLNMQLANLVGIQTPSFNLIKLKNGVSAYIVKRMDRVNKQKIHMEDFSQLSNRGTEYKYNSSYEFCLKIIDKYCKRALIEKDEFIYRLLFCFVTLNSDMHLKNFSFIEDGKKITLSPAYDFLPVNLIYPNDKEEIALTLNGKHNNITRNDFLTLNKYLNGNKKIIINLIKRLISYKTQMIEMINNSFLNDDLKKKYITLMLNRFDKLK